MPCRRTTRRAYFVFLSRRRIPAPKSLRNRALRELPKGMHKLQKAMGEITEQCFSGIYPYNFLTTIFIRIFTLPFTDKITKNGTISAVSHFTLRIISAQDASGHGRIIHDANEKRQSRFTYDFKYERPIQDEFEMFFGLSGSGQ